MKIYIEERIVGDMAFWQTTIEDAELPRYILRKRYESLDHAVIMLAKDIRTFETGRS